MANNFTPEKKAQLKKAVLDSIESPASAVKPTIKAARKNTTTIAKRAINNGSPKPLIRKKFVPKKIDVLNSISQSPLTPQKTTFSSSQKSSWDESFFNSRSLPSVKKLKEKRKSNNPAMLIVAILLVLIGLFAFDIFAIYRLDWKDSLSVKVAAILNLPAASVNGKAITVSEYLNDLNILEYALANDREGVADNSITSSNKETILERLISIELAKEQLQKYGKSISDKDLDESLNNLVSQFGSQQEAEQSVQKLYGINLAQFKIKILKPLLERDLLQSLIANDDSLDINKKAKEKGEMVLNLALKPGANFSELAKQYTDDETGINTGGDLGYLNKGDLPVDVENILFSLANNTIYSKLVKNSMGYHIFYVESKIKDATTSKEVVKAKQIFIKVDVNEYIKNLMLDSKVKRYVKVN